jgi:hypothetical protein
VEEHWILNSCLRAVYSSDEALTLYGGLVAWDLFLQYCRVIAELAENHPMPRTSPNATPMAAVFKMTSRWPKITGMHQGRHYGEDAFRRLCAGLDACQVEAWFAPAEQLIHHAIPPNAVAEWDSTVILRYGRQEDTAVGYNPQKPGHPVSGQMPHVHSPPAFQLRILG